MARREFSKSDKVAIIKRATINGQVLCEHGLCRAVCRKWEIHHLEMDALQVDKSKKLTPKDGLLLCIPCHKEITKAQAPILAKAIRREAKHLGAKASKQKIPSRPKADREPKATFVSTSSMQSNIMRRFCQ
jgi:hypothetical protein